VAEGRSGSVEAIGATTYFMRFAPPLLRTRTVGRCPRRTILPTGRRREMRRQEAGAAVGMLLDQTGCASCATIRESPAGERRPLRLEELKWMVDHVTHKDAGGVARAGVDHDVPRGVPGRTFEPQPVLEWRNRRRPAPIARFAPNRPARCPQRRGGAVCVFAVLVHLLPMRELAAGPSRIARWGKSGPQRPFSSRVFQPT